MNQTDIAMTRTLIWIIELILNVSFLPKWFADAPVPTPSTASGTAALQMHYRTVNVDGVDVFYREAGPRDGPGLILLHGFHTSSHMFRDLITRLDDKYHIIAPDYPGYGYSGAFKRDIPKVEIHMFDTGHFVLGSNGLEIAALIREFLGRSVG
jgi:hypothetical protein